MTTNDPGTQGLQFVYATYIKATPEQLWQALTDPSFTERYWGVALRSDWKQGSAITWEVAGVTIADPEQVVLAADEPRRLAFTWHTITPEFGAAVGAPGDEFAAMAAEGRSRVAFEIEPLTDMAKLTVTHSGFEEGSAVLAGVTDGWPGVVASLKTLLETGEPLVFS
ncbi:SRPBCC family protein [Arthrobacter celericrescens]|uniref:SRPBCC family protein n=1 Tax=Arthrobacter celericrescens TaxID=2320851 RepID=UPI000EA1F5EE|nr:SRPBCC family protein [Arthrobacter celericrescens]